MHAFDRQTDGRTDGQTDRQMLIARCDLMKLGAHKNVSRGVITVVIEE